MNVRDDEILRRKSIVREERDYTSAKLSELARYIGFGLAGLTLVLYTSSSPFAVKLLTAFRGEILFVSAVGCVVILFDFLQYLVGYKISVDGYRHIEEIDRTKKFVDLFDERWVRLRIAFFYLKISASLAGSFGLIVILVCAIFTPR